MENTVRPLTLDDQSFLWEMLYQAIYVPDGQPALPQEIVQIPELARYVADWGREGDCGFLSTNVASQQTVGAVWLRLPIGEHKGYGYVDDPIPELSIAVLPNFRGQGIGTQLMTHLLTSACGQSPISLSVSADNPAVRLYQRFGFETISQQDGSLTMKRP
ncbi:MAG: GNAT family N-acetyltransferase [Leptolyngbyaceae cyanobacterium]